MGTSIEVRRNSQWDEQLYRTIDEWKRYDWSRIQYDCVRFVCSVLSNTCTVIEGKKEYPFNPGGSMLNAYSSDENARALVRREGGFPKLIAKRLEKFGLEEIPIRTAFRLDVVLIRESLLGSVGICDGRRVLTFGTRGLEAYSTNKCVRAWRIPF